MIELKDNSLSFSFPDVYPEVRFNVTFQRTLRLPDDGKEYPLPPGLGRFPMRHVDDFAENIPNSWVEHGGVMLPMYQSEALWLNFNSSNVADRGVWYPFAFKVAAGKINALTGSGWTDWLQRSPQDYMVCPSQFWLDGFCVERGIIRQFVAMPLGSGYSAEEQITEDAQYGGIQIIVYSMKKKAFKRLFPKRRKSRLSRFGLDLRQTGIPVDDMMQEMNFAARSRKKREIYTVHDQEHTMAYAAGGQMKQEIYADSFDLDDWDMNNYSRCFVHVANSLMWKAITGESPQTLPLTANEYTEFGLPWFEYYSENTKTLNGSEELSKLKSVFKMEKEKGEMALPENESVDPKNIVKLREGLAKDQVREGSF